MALLFQPGLIINGPVRKDLITAGPYFSTGKAICHYLSILGPEPLTRIESHHDSFQDYVYPPVIKLAFPGPIIKFGCVFPQGKNLHRLRRQRVVN